MDDTTSRQQIDELADLYLTDAGQDNPVQGPAPIKLAPKLDREQAGIRLDLDDAPPATFDDSHPVLRLTEEDADEQPPARFDSDPTDTAATSTQPPQKANEPAPRAVLEAVLMGNLPGMSGPWLTQYAQLLAQTEGPVILLHVHEEGIDLELVEPRPEAQPTPLQPSTTVRIPPMRGDRTGLVGLIDALVRSDQSPARTILVRFDAASDAQTLSRLSAMDDWTLLCGSDDASIAAASRQLRTAVHNDPRLADRNVGVMVMGSDDDAAQSAARRIAENLEHDLVHRVELIGHLRRMQPVQVRDLGSFPDTVALWPKLVSFFDTLEVPEPIAPPIAPAATTPKAPPAATTRPTPPSAARSAASRPDPAPQFRQTSPAAATPRPTTAALNNPPTAASTRPNVPPTAAETTKAPAQTTSTPRPTATRAPARPVATPTRPTPTPRVLTPQPELDLVALLAQGPAALTDPVTLDARIPQHSDTQLAVDAAGTVHLLKKGSGVVSDDLVQLIDAGQWVAEHLELLALTQRDRDFVDTPPMLHLLTDQAAQIAGQRHRPVRLHLLQQVTLGKETGWFCTPMG